MANAQLLDGTLEIFASRGHDVLAASSAWPSSSPLAVLAPLVEGFSRMLRAQAAMFRPLLLELQPHHRGPMV